MIQGPEEHPGPVTPPGAIVNRQKPPPSYHGREKCLTNITWASDPPLRVTKKKNFDPKNPFSRIHFKHFWQINFAPPQGVTLVILLILFQKASPNPKEYYYSQKIVIRFIVILNQFGSGLCSLGCVVTSVTSRLMSPPHDTHDTHHGALTLLSDTF